MRRSPIAVLVALALAILLATPLPLAAETVRLTILHFNDLDRMEPTNGRGGVAKLMSALQAERERAAQSITTFGGDTISPSLMSGIDQGAHMIALFNAMKVDVAVAGNHEFDFGPDVLQTRFAESEFPWLATNVVNEEGGVLNGAREVWMTERAGLKIGFFGLVTQETPSLANPGEGTEFLDPPQIAEQAAAQLREAGADLVVGLTHQSLDEDLALIADETDIDLILGGHDHTAIAYYDGRTLLMKAGSQGEYLGVVDLVVDTAPGGGAERVRWRPEMRLVATADLQPHQRIGAQVYGFLAQLDAELSRPVAVLDRPMDTTGIAVRSEENAFGNLVADAMREATGSDLAMFNGGSIRGDRVYEAGVTLTRKHVIAELPFRNRVTVVKLIGEDVISALENGLAQIEEGSGRFPHVSGMRVTYDMARPPGGRILSVDVRGQPLDVTTFYQLATTDFLAGGGDGYDMLSVAESVTGNGSGQLLTQLLIERWSERERIAPQIDGRLSNQETKSGQ
ncbi:MAG: 5'-nucleotidase C-terminal domain-containing protein [Alphaproteobacteria bacterium]|nr:5'-nucleotidase C-terminal domain-containing protein [Alphaproteobacteria bacterium]